MNKQFIYKRTGYNQTNLFLSSDNRIIGGPGHYEIKWLLENNNLFFLDNTGNKRVIFFNDNDNFSGYFLDNNNIKVTLECLKPRIAILLSGQARSYDKTNQSIFENLLQNVDYDFFIHTWIKRGFGNAFSNGYSEEEISIDDIVKIYDPKSILVEDQDEIKDNINTLVYNRSPHGTNSVNPICQAYSMNRAQILLNKYSIDVGILYDAVVRLRFDMSISSKIDFKKIIYKYSKTNSILVPCDFWHGSETYKINDKFAIGSFRNMNIYTGIYNFMYEYILKEMHEFSLEPMIAWHLKNNNVGIIPIEINYSIVK